MFKEGLLRTSFTLNIKTHRATYVIQYEQATIEQLMEWEFTLKHEHTMIWLCKFVQEHLVSVKPARWWYRRTMTRKDFIAIPKDEMVKLRDKIQETRFKMPATKVSPATKSNPPFESFLVFLSEKLSVSPLVLIKDYTLEQAILLARGIEYNANEATPE